MFAAAFLSTLPPNFLRARLLGGQLDTAVGQLEIAALPGEQRSALAAHREIYLGIRPEALHPRPALEGRPGLTFEAEPTRIETIGNDRIMHVRLRGGGSGNIERQQIAELCGRRQGPHLLWTTRRGKNPDAQALAVEVAVAVASGDLMLLAADGTAIGPPTGLHA